MGTSPSKSLPFVIHLCLETSLRVEPQPFIGRAAAGLRHFLVVSTRRPSPYWAPGCSEIMRVDGGYRARFAPDGKGVENQFAAQPCPQPCKASTRAKTCEPCLGLLVASLCASRGCARVQGSSFSNTTQPNTTSNRTQDRPAHLQPLHFVDLALPTALQRIHVERYHTIPYHTVPHHT